MKSMRGISSLIGGLVGLAYLAVAGAANASLITIDFTGIFDACNYSEDGFDFACTGDHTDKPNELAWHDVVQPVGDNDIILTFGGSQFSILSTDISQFSGFQILTSAGTFTAAATGTSLAINLLNITTATFETNALTVIDNLVLDNAVVVPEPSTLALFAFGLAGLGFFMRRRRRVV